jgi:hypothetical protein
MNRTLRAGSSRPANRCRHPGRPLVVVIALLLAASACLSRPVRSEPLSMVGVGLEIPWWERVETVKVSPAAPTGAPKCVWVIPGDVLFDTGSAVIRDEAAVDSLAPQLSGSPVVEVVGHTDSTGSSEVNMKISALRAAAITARLAAAGVPSSRIRNRPLGESVPRADETGPDPVGARALNRRVEIVGACK